MKLRTKMRLKFYLSLAILVLSTIATGVLFEYVGWNLWRMQLGLTPTIEYRYFGIMAIILFLLCIVDIVLFFRLILRRQYW